MGDPKPAAPHDGGSTLVNPATLKKSEEPGAIQVPMPMPIPIPMPFKNKMDNAPEPGGKMLPASFKHEMESKFGKDFSDVKVHTGAVGQQVCLMKKAKSYSVRNHVCFAPGEFQPFTAGGKDLVVHELTHVVTARVNQAVSTWKPSN